MKIVLVNPKPECLNISDPDHTRILEHKLYASTNVLFIQGPVFGWQKAAVLTQFVKKYLGRSGCRRHTRSRFLGVTSNTRIFGVDTVRPVQLCHSRSPSSCIQQTTTTSQAEYKDLKTRHSKT